MITIVTKKNGTSSPTTYGDFLGWMQLIELASEKKTDVILVTDDRKEDWWAIVDKETVGPRPELIEEFKKTSGQRIWIYQADRFLYDANQYLHEDIADMVIKEVEAGAGAGAGNGRDNEEASATKASSNEEKLSNADKKSAPLGEYNGGEEKMTEASNDIKTHDSMKEDE